MRYHVSLDGAAGPDVQLDDEPCRGELIEKAGARMRVYEVVDGGDGSRVIIASLLGAARWTIIDGPNRQEGTEDELWVTTVTALDDPTKERKVRVWISGSVIACDVKTLPPDVRRALATETLSCVKATLDDIQPPDNIYVGSNGIGYELDY